MRYVITYFFYPAIALLSATFAYLSLTGGHDLQRAYTVFAGVRFAIFLLVEWRWPARADWKMTWSSFRRDLKYIIAGGAVSQAAKFATGWLAIGVAGSVHTPISDLPTLVQLLIAMLGYELVQYWLHRLSHEARGTVGRWLWRIHVVHHLPRRVYFLMHPVMHPINMLYIIAIGLIPVAVLGVGKEAMFVFNLLMGLQGLFSHFNAPIKAGPLNYLLVGTELHRLHHSANLAEAGNYGALTPIWDLVFGTYVAAQHDLPEQLGVVEPARYPTSNDFWSCLHLPFDGSHPLPPTGNEP